MRTFTLGLWLSLVSCASGASGRVDRLQGSLDALTPVGQPAAADPLHGLDRLDRRTFVAAVLARHPSLEAARAAVQAAIARVEIDGRLPDPMVSFSFAPLSLGAGAVPFGAAVELRQRIPLPGRVGALEEVAVLRAEMERDEAESVRRVLAAAAASAFDDHGLVRGALALNQERAKLVELMQASVEADYAAGRGPATARAELEMEALRILRERWQLEAEGAQIEARMNLLLRRPADAPLPPRVASERRAHLPSTRDLAVLEERALAARPELRGAARGVAEAELMQSLARWESWPEFEFMTGYNSMWHDPEHRWMVGFGLSLPIFPGARRGARAEAEAAAARARAGLEARSLEVRTELHEAARRLAEIEAAITLYEERMVPLAKERMELVRAGVDAAVETHRSLIEAERGLFEVELELLSMRREAERRADALTLAVGRVPGLENEEEQP